MVVSVNKKHQICHRKPIKKNTSSYHSMHKIYPNITLLNAIASILIFPTPEYVFSLTGKKSCLQWMLLLVFPSKWPQILLSPQII